MRDKSRKIVEEFCGKSGISALVEGSRAVIVAFSGGADSSYLLDYAVKEYKGKRICAAHFNHMIRGQEADRDEEFCRRRAAFYGVEFFCERADVLKIASDRKLSTEECGRILRYDFLDKCRNIIANEENFSMSKVLVATAHNADDNVETVLFNLSRGTALKGAAGIPAIRDGYCIRPLLALSSGEIREECKEEGITFTVDSTNAENIYSRNIIRNGALPPLRELNESIHRSFLRFSRLVQKEDEYMDCVAVKALGEYFDKTQAPRAILSSMEEPILARAVVLLYKNISNEELTASHIDKLCELICKKGDFEYCLPDKIRVKISDRVVFSKKSEKTDEKDRVAEFEFVLEKGSSVGEAFGFILSLNDIKEQVPPEDGNVYRTLTNEVFINDKIKGTLYMRNRREGDLYRYGKINRKVKKLFCDKKIPKEKRARIPLICDDDGIVWIPGFPPRDDVKAASIEDAKYILSYYPTERN